MGDAENISKAVLDIICRLFICRTDRYGIQWCRDGEVGYRAERGKITPGLLRRHLKSEITLATYAGKPPGQCKFLAFDFDHLDLGPVRKLQDFFSRYGAKIYVEFSGKKGHHGWLFTDPAPNWKIRAVALRAIKETGIGDVEIFPAQNRVSKEHPGSLIKLPLGKHRATGKKCLFLNSEGQPYGNQYEFLRQIKKVDIDNLAKKLKIRRNPQAQRKLKGKGQTPPQLKPCVENLIRDGMEEGYRNEAAFLIACELRRANPAISRETVGGVLAAFGLRCEPPLRRDELQSVLKSAFRSGTVYEFGCNWGGPPLKEVIGYYCDGRSDCLYLDMLKNLNDSYRENDKNRQKRIKRRS